jgi:Kef-type K+ transport system membrane component KefB
MDISLQILLTVAVLILAAKLLGALAGRVGLPVVLGELLAGVLLGPTVLNIWGLSWFAPKPGLGFIGVEAVFKVLAQLGVVLLMFVAGLETNTQMLRQEVAPAFWAAFGGVVFPLVGGSLVSHAAGLGWPQAIFLGTVLTATSVTITAQSLMNLQQVRSKPGSILLGAAVIDDVLGLVVLSLVIAMAPQFGQASSAPWRSVAVTLGRMAICLGTIFWLGPPLTRWIFKSTERLHGMHTDLAAAVFIAFLLAFHAQWTGGMAAITGSYLAGLFVSATPAHERVSQEIHPMIHSFFGPLFFVSVGLSVDAWQLRGHFGFFAVLLLVAIAGKVVGCGLGALFNGATTRESLIVGVGMIPRGEVGLIAASLGLAAGLLERVTYAQVVVLVLAVDLVTPGLLRFAFPKDTLAKAIAAGEGMDHIA